MNKYIYLPGSIFGQSTSFHPGWALLSQAYKLLYEARFQEEITPKWLQRPLRRALLTSNGKRHLDLP